MQEFNLIVGYSNIGAVMGKSRWTIARWIKEQAFPAAKLPDGRYATTPGLIEQWILARSEVREEKRKARP